MIREKKKEKLIRICPKCGSTDTKSTILGSTSFTTKLSIAEGGYFAFRCSNCNFTLPPLMSFPKIKSSEIKKFRKK